MENTNIQTLVLVTLTDLIRRCSDLEQRMNEAARCHEEERCQLRDEIEKLKQRLEHNQSDSFEEEVADDRDVDATYDVRLGLEAGVTDLVEAGTIVNVETDKESREASVARMARRTHVGLTSDSTAEHESDEVVSQEVDMDYFQETRRDQRLYQVGSTRESMGGENLPFTCHRCPDAFASFEQLQGHLSSNHTRGSVKDSNSKTLKQYYECQYCKNQFKSKGGLRRHEQIHTPVKRNLRQCNYPGCGRLYYREAFELHQIRNHPLKGG